MTAGGLVTIPLSRYARPGGLGTTAIVIIVCRLRHRRRASGLWMSLIYAVVGRGGTGAQLDDVMTLGRDDQHRRPRRRCPGGSLFGVTMVLPIGGADMPVVISLLNAFTGTAVAMAGLRHRQLRS